MKLQVRVLLGHARQGIGARHLPCPQHQMLPGAVPQATLRLKAQAQHRRTQPIGTLHPRRQAITQRIKRLDPQISADPALTRQAPAVLALRRAQRVRLLVVDFAMATHQARMATAGPATVGHGHTCLIQGIQQVAAGGDRPVAFADVQFRHIRVSSIRSAHRESCLRQFDHSRVYRPPCRVILPRLLASRLHHFGVPWKVGSADRCSTEPTFIECSLIEERDS